MPHNAFLSYKSHKTHFSHKEQQFLMWFRRSVFSLTDEQFLYISPKKIVHKELFLFLSCIVAKFQRKNNT